MTGTRWVMEKWRGKGYFTWLFNCLIFGQTSVFLGKLRVTYFTSLGGFADFGGQVTLPKATTAVPQKAPSGLRIAKCGWRSAVSGFVVFDAEVSKRSWLPVVPKKGASHASMMAFTFFHLQPLPWVPPNPWLGCFLFFFFFLIGLPWWLIW